MNATNNDDKIVGTSGPNRINGKGGNDVLNGRGGNDILNGGEDNDILNGSSGNDILIGARGKDTLIGGKGADQFKFSQITSHKRLGGKRWLITTSKQGSDIIADFNPKEGDRIFSNRSVYFVQTASPNERAGTPPRGDGSAALTIDLVDFVEFFFVSASLNDLENLEIPIKILNIDDVDLVLDNDPLPRNPNHVVVIELSGVSSVGFSREVETFVQPSESSGGGQAEKQSIELAISGNKFEQVVIVSLENDLDPIWGTDSSDILRGSNNYDVIFGGMGKDTLLGKAGDDIITGQAGGDSIQGGKGNDSIYGNSGSDVIGAGNGDDILNGGPGRDFLRGGKGNDNIFGWTGKDRLLGNAGNDLLEGESGSDFLNGGFGDDTLDGGSGNNTIKGGNGDDSLIGGSGRNTLKGGNGNDVIVVSGKLSSINGGSGQDTLDVNIEIDRIEGLSNEPSILNYRISDTQLISKNRRIQFQGIENIIVTGTDFNERIDSSSITQANISIQGGGGDDTITGSSGNDSLSGGSGSDTIIGGNGDDILNASFGFSGEYDVLYGDLSSTPGVDNTDEGADIFALGNSSGTFYKGAGFATIKDFDIAEGDQFNVHGGIRDYQLTKAGGDALIFYKNDLIALVEGTTNILLEQDFNFL